MSKEHDDRLREWLEKKEAEKKAEKAEKEKGRQ